MIDSSDFVFGAFLAACFAGFLALAALVRMQDRLAELKTERDELKAERDDAVAARKKAEIARDEAKAQLSASLRNLSQVTNALEMVTGLNTIANLNPPYVGRASIPDTPTCPIDDAPGTDPAWVDEMRARWATDLPTGEDS